MQRLEGLEEGKCYIGNCYLTDDQKKIAYKNPHCVEYFCKIDNISNCTKCYNFLKKKKIQIYHNNLFSDQLKANKESKKYCDKHCTDGFIYNYVESSPEKDKLFAIDKYKTTETFNCDKLIYKYSDLPYLVDYENTYPKPKSIVHWGQLKMLLTTLFFLMKKINLTDEEVHIIYAGSAPGDSLLLLCKMFPNTKWYLIDPRRHNKLLYKKMENNDQICEIIEGYFTDEIAKKYSIQFKDRKYKLLFMSDIREGTDDDKVLDDQTLNANWHKIIQPDYSYLKFRCGFESDVNYNYYEGKIYLQFYARQSSTETRILFEKELTPCVYNIREFEGKLFYFNRVIRPAFHKSLIKNNDLFDHCYDCTYFGYVIKNYLTKFASVNPFKDKKGNKDTDILNIMKYICNFTSKYSQNKIELQNSYVRNNIINK